MLLVSSPLALQMETGREKATKHFPTSSAMGGMSAEESCGGACARNLVWGMGHLGSPGRLGPSGTLWEVERALLVQIPRVV